MKIQKHNSRIQSLLMAALMTAGVFTAAPISASADENYQPIVLTPDEPAANYIYGDLNYDGSVDSADALAILRSTVGADSFSEMQDSLGDVDGDETITSNDALLVLRYSVNYKVSKKVAAKYGVEFRDYALVKTVEKYEYDYGVESLTLSSVTDYEYKNAYPVSSKMYEYSSDSNIVTTYEYTFEDDIPVSMNQIDDQGVVQQTTEYNNGRVFDIGFSLDNDTHKKRILHQYGNGDAYFTLLLSDERINSPEFTMAREEVDSISVTTKNGLLEKTVNTGLFANWDGVDNSKKSWQRFNGTYSAYYDDDGIVNYTYGEYRDGHSGILDTIDVTWKNGRVTEVSKKRSVSENSDPIVVEKYVFEYTDTEIDAARYASMINAQVMGMGNYYYYYYWY